MDHLDESQDSALLRHNLGTSPAPPGGALSAPRRSPAGNPVGWVPSHPTVARWRHDRPRGAGTVRRGSDWPAGRSRRATDVDDSPRVPDLSVAELGRLTTEPSGCRDQKSAPAVRSRVAEEGCMEIGSASPTGWRSRLTQERADLIFCARCSRAPGRGAVDQVIRHVVGHLIDLRSGERACLCTVRQKFSTVRA